MQYIYTHHTYLHVPTTTATANSNATVDASDGGVDRHGHKRQVEPELCLVLPALDEAADPLQSAGGALTRLYSWRFEGGQGQPEHLMVGTDRQCEYEGNVPVSRGNGRTVRNRTNSPKIM